MLTLSKLENAQLRLWKKEIQLRPMLEDLIEKYTAKADKPVHFSLHLESEWVYADEEFLKEAIGNLVDNSIKYSGEEVDIQISSLRQDYNFYLIKVRDNGIGIPLKDQSRIFEKYERASFNSSKEVTDEYIKYTDMLYDLIIRGFSAAVYTQTTDVEVEVNGLMTYDRKVIKVDEKRVREANARICKSLK